jgi:hypothetical protein
MRVSFFFTSFVWNILHSKKNWVRYDQKCLMGFIKSARHSCQVLMKIEFSRHIFEKYSNIKFNENPCIGGRVFSMRTDGRTGVTKSIVPFRNFAKAIKNRLLVSSYLFFSPSVRSSGCLSVSLPACLSVCLSVYQNFNSNSAVLARRMFLQFDSVKFWNTPIWLIADNNIGRFTWGSNFHLYWWQQYDIFCSSTKCKGSSLLPFRGHTDSFKLFTSAVKSTIQRKCTVALP